MSGLEASGRGAAKPLLPASPLPCGRWGFQVPYDTTCKGKGIRLEVRKVDSRFSPVHDQLHGLGQFH